MALTPLPSSIGQGLNPRPSDREPSALPLDHGFRISSEKSCVLFEYPYSTFGLKIKVENLLPKDLLSQIIKGHKVEFL